MTGPSRKPESSSQVVPVISPLPLRVNHAPKTGSVDSLPRGSTAVTPVRTGPTPTCNLPAPEISVVWPTSTPFTSVIALNAPGAPSNGTPRSRARGLACATAKAAPPARTTSRQAREKAFRMGRGTGGLLGLQIGQLHSASEDFAV